LAATFALTQLAGAAAYTWNVTSGNWSDASSWTPATGVGGPLAADIVSFGVNDTSASSTTVNNVVDVGFRRHGLQSGPIIQLLQPRFM